MVMKHRYTNVWMVAPFAAALVAGCGGGGGSSSNSGDPTPPRPTNAAPTVSALSNQSMDEGATLGPLAFSVGDAESDAGALTVVATSSDTALIPVAGLELEGSGATRSLTITPAPEGAGSADITITVTDGSGATGTAVFKLAVNPLLRAQFSSWFRGTPLPRKQDENPVGLPATQGEALPQIEDINRIHILDDTAEDAHAYDDLLPPPEPTEGSV
jgi:hypothetical protein